MREKGVGWGQSAVPRPHLQGSWGHGALLVELHVIKVPGGGTARGEDDVPLHLGLEPGAERLFLNVRAEDARGPVYALAPLVRELLLRSLAGDGDREREKESECDCVSLI